jgi:hypothetical protein
MSKFRTASIVLAGLFLGAVAPAFAHHSFTAEFDGTKLVVLTGTLTKIEWENPHVWFYLDIKDADGNVQNWAFESVSPNHLRNQTPTSRAEFEANIGKTMSVSACPAKRNVNRANARFVRFNTGEIMRVGVDAYQGPLNPEQALRDLPQ